MIENMCDINLKTDRLVLRKMEDNDKELVSRIARESPFYFDISEPGKYESLYEDSYWEEVNRADIFNVMIFLKETGEFVGKICMEFIDKPLSELGIDILEDYRNKGYGAESIIAFCNWYSEKFNIDKVKVRIRKDNHHSIHIFEKIGAEFITSTSYVSENSLEMIQQLLPDADLSKLSQNSVREYLLKLPIAKEKE